ncbi:MAG: N-acetyltransferase [Clostridiales bacterium]|nr:N-acetyltransferase [Clostridiales bacterium]
MQDANLSEYNKYIKEFKEMNLENNNKIRIVYEPENNRAAAYDVDKEIGEITFEPEDASWLVEHTYVDDAYRGHKIAKKLVDEIVYRAKEEGITIVPICPYVKKVFRAENK